jgi:hypothetical protein
MPTTTIKPTRKEYELWLNETTKLMNHKPAANFKYGTWLKLSNPEAFKIGFIDWLKNN